MTTDISLAEWIAGLRADLAEAVEWEDGRKRQASVSGRELTVPSLRLDQIKLEVEVRATRETTSKAGLKFWVVAGDVDRKHGGGTTQAVTLTLTPTREVELGDDDGFLDPATT